MFNVSNNLIYTQKSPIHLKKHNIGSNGRKYVFLQSKSAITHTNRYSVVCVSCSWP